MNDLEIGYVLMAKRRSGSQLPASAIRKNIQKVYFSDQEFLDFKKIATAFKLSKSETIRLSIFKNLPSINLTALSEIQKIGNNLNQLLKKLNSGGAVAVNEIKILLSELRAILRGQKNG